MIAGSTTRSRPQLIERERVGAHGDVGRIDEEILTIVDRKRDVIVSGGFNVCPTEVENAILTLVGVREAAGVGAPDDRWVRP